MSLMPRRLFIANVQPRKSQRKSSYLRANPDNRFSVDVDGEKRYAREAKSADLRRGFGNDIVVPPVPGQYKSSYITDRDSLGKTRRNWFGLTRKKRRRNKHEFQAKYGDKYKHTIREGLYGEHLDNYIIGEDHIDIYAQYSSMNVKFISVLVAFILATITYQYSLLTYEMLSTVGAHFTIGMGQGLMKYSPQLILALMPIITAIENMTHNGSTTAKLKDELTQQRRQIRDLIAQQQKLVQTINSSSPSILTSPTPTPPTSTQSTPPTSTLPTPNEPLVKLNEAVTDFQMNNQTMTGGDTTTTWYNWFIPTPEGVQHVVLYVVIQPIISFLYNVTLNQAFKYGSSLLHLVNLASIGISDYLGFDVRTQRPYIVVNGKKYDYKPIANAIKQTMDEIKDDSISTLGDKLQTMVNDTIQSDNVVDINKLVESEVVNALKKTIDSHDISLVDELIWHVVMAIDNPTFTIKNVNPIINTIFNNSEVKKQLDILKNFDTSSLNFDKEELIEQILSLKPIVTIHPSGTRKRRPHRHPSRKSKHVVNPFGPPP